ncbi:hypothetical protein LVY74_15020, partial [Acinetobacter sp. ME22]|uniref:hypothetical protein n=1 Tax=Acinetobacter sp. ME22 TaxID=2904802 RepID=UPI001EDA2FD9
LKKLHMYFSFIKYVNSMAAKLMIFVKNVFCIVLGFFIPLVISVLVFSIYILLKHTDNSTIDGVIYAKNFFLFLFLFLLLAISSSGIKSIIYSFIMNLFVLPKLKKAKNIILISSILGGLFGLGSLIFNLILNQTFYFDLWYFYIILFDCVVGAISGYLLLKIRSLLF